MIELAALAGGAAVGVSLALAGFGYWALVGQSLSLQAILMLVAFGRTGYRPTRPSIDQGTKKMLRFGGYLAAYGIVNYFARNLDNVLIGRVWGAEQLGYYSRAYFLVMLPATLSTGSLMGVMVPSLSTLSFDHKRMADAYRKALAAVAASGCPLSVGLAVTAPEAVRLVYGPKWAPVVPLLVWLSIAGVLQPLHNTMGWLFVVSGKSREMFSWGLVATAVLAAGFFIGITRGPLGVAVAYGLTMGVLAVPALYYAHRVAGVDFRTTLQTIAPFLTAAMIMGLSVVAIGHVLVMVRIHWLTILALKLTIGVAVYVIVCRRPLMSLLRDVVGLKANAQLSHT